MPDEVLTVVGRDVRTEWIPKTIISHVNNTIILGHMNGRTNKKTFFVVSGW